MFYFYFFCSFRVSSTSTKRTWRRVFIWTRTGSSGVSERVLKFSFCFPPQTVEGSETRVRPVGRVSHSTKSRRRSGPGVGRLTLEAGSSPGSGPAEENRSAETRQVLNHGGVEPALLLRMIVNLFPCKTVSVGIYFLNTLINMI